MNKTKTEDLIDFRPKKKKKIIYDVTFYKDGALLISVFFHAKSKLDLKKYIQDRIEISWPADKDKISYKIR